MLGEIQRNSKLNNIDIIQSSAYSILSAAVIFSLVSKIQLQFSICHLATPEIVPRDHVNKIADGRGRERTELGLSEHID